MDRRRFFRGVVAAVSGLVGAVYGLGRPRVGPDGLTNEDIDHDLMRRDYRCKGRHPWLSINSRGYCTCRWNDRVDAARDGVVMRNYAMKTVSVR